MQNHDWVAWTGNSLSLGAIVATLAGWLPPLAALAAILWYALQCWESKTVQAWVKRRRERRRARLRRKLAKLGDD